MASERGQPLNNGGDDPSPLVYSAHLAVVQDVWESLVHPVGAAFQEHQVDPLEVGEMAEGAPREMGGPEVGILLVGTVGGTREGGGNLERGALGV